VIVGDMDSVSDKALRSGAEVLVHGYLDGVAPGEERATQLGPGCGTGAPELLPRAKGAGREIQRRAF